MGKEIRTEGRQDSESKRAVKRVQPMFGEVGDLFDLAQDNPCTVDDILANGRQQDTRSASFHQLHTQLEFHVLELPADGRLADMGEFSRAAEMALVGDGDQVSQLFQCDHDVRSMVPLIAQVPLGGATKHTNVSNPSLISNSYQNISLNQFH